MAAPPAVVVLMAAAAVVSSPAGALDILVLHPFYSGSHVKTVHALATEMVGRNHTVTTVRFADQQGYSLPNAGPRLRDIVLHVNNSDGRVPFYTKGEKAVFSPPLELVWGSGLDVVSLLTYAKVGDPWRMTEAACDAILGDEDLLEELRAARFDIAVVDLLSNECGLALAHNLTLPVVGFWGSSFVSLEAELTVASTPPSHIPMFMSGLTHSMSFLERVRNFGQKALMRLIMWVHCWRTDGFIAKHLPGSPPSLQMMADISGCLVNHHSSWAYPRLQPETFVHVAGLQLNKEPRPLPEDIADFIEGAEHGVILFTMGITFYPSDLPPHLVGNFLDAFSRLPQRVIMKLTSVPDKVPDNVMVKPFLPQQEILAHPKTLVFFTHCGVAGIMEAAAHAVPMVGMPIFADQGDNLVNLAERGVAVGVGSKNPTPDEIYDAVVKVRDDPTFKENILVLSRLQRLERHSPMENAVWLLEYVAATGGAEHLKLSSRHLNMLQYFSLDVVTFLALAAGVLSKGSGALLKGACSAISIKVPVAKRLKQD